MTKKFDLLAIGTGSAASGAALRCRAAGWHVAIVDSRPFGGTCALRGCDPKKVLVSAADALDRIDRMRGKGIHGETLGIDWRELMRFKRSFTDPIPKNREQEFETAGIAAFHGRARFVGPSASYESMVVAANLLKGNHQKPNFMGVPSVVFTIPPLASVGLGEREAVKGKLRFRVKKENTSAWQSSRRVGRSIPASRP